VVSGELVRGLRGQIVSRLRDDILSGRLAEGQRLSEALLAGRFDVSRPTIREVLVQLTNEGLLLARPHCGVRVAAPAPDSVRAVIIPIRRTIETYALRLFFDDITPDDFRGWQKILSKMEAAGREKDRATAVEQDIAFHRSLLERAGQPDLLAIWTTIVARIRHHFWRTHLSCKNRPIDVYADHRALVEAFRTGDKEAAVKSLEEHIA
jgi:DNA-binding GntR family transcriptional regulator